MLSRPPAAFAISMSRAQATPRSASARTVASISASFTIPVRPSEQRSRMSPSRTSMDFTSTVTSGSTPSACRMMFRPPSFSASSSVSVPSSMSCEMSDWSFVTWTSFPLRSR